MNLDLFLFAVGCCMLSLISAEVDPTWPQYHKLVGFWPFNEKSGTTNVVDDKDFSYIHMPLLVTAEPGPFGVLNSSFTVKKFYPESYIGHMSIAPPKSFTVSFYLNTAADHFGGILCFQYSIFALTFDEPNILKVYTNEWGGIFPSSYSFKVVKANQWQFFAVTYNDEQHQLAVYDDKGKRLGLEQNVRIMKPMVAQLYVGWANWIMGYANMQEGDKLACLMYYDTILTSYDIHQLPAICEEQTPKPEIPTTPETLPVTTAAAQPVITTVKEEEPPKTEAPTTKAPEQPTTTATEQPTTKAPEQPTTAAPIIITTPQSSGPLPEAWPRYSEMLGYWPLDSKYNAKDLSANGLNGPVAGLNLVDGPFGAKDTAVTVTAANEKIFEVLDSKLSVADKSFTLSFFLRKQDSNKEGGIVELLPLRPENGGKAFQVRYASGTTLELGANGVTVGQFPIVKQGGEWTFVALAYDKVGTLTVYDKSGVVLPATPKPQLKIGMTYNNNGIRVGYSSRWKEGLQLGDAIACIGLHSVALNAEEVTKLMQTCSIVHGN